MTTLHVVIPLPDELPTPNRRWYWAKRAKVVAEMRLTARVCATSARIGANLPPADGKRYVTAVLARKRSRGRRLLDPDNAIAGALKACLDGCRDAQVLRGDDPSMLALVGLEQVWDTRDFVVLRISDRLEEVAA